MSDDLMVGKSGVDPLTTNSDRGPQELFKRYSHETHGFPLEAAIGAASNIILNTLRQQFKSRRDADQALTRLMETMRSSLSDHYTGVGDRRSIFPFHQVIELPGVIQFGKSRKFNGHS